MTSLSTHLRAQHLSAQLPPLPPNMRGNAGRERARHLFVTRTLKALSTADGTVCGDRAEDWRRVARQCVSLWQMGSQEFRGAVFGLDEAALAASTEEPEPVQGPAETGPKGGAMIFPWQAMFTDWVVTPSGVAGLFAGASMAMPDRTGVAQTVVLIDQSHRFLPDGPPHADVYLDTGVRIERLDTAAELSRAREQWAKDREEWYAR